MLNARSLKRHNADKNRARQLADNDICLTESQITNDTDVTDILEQLSTFKIYFYSCAVRHQNLAFCPAQNIAFSKDYTFPGISVIDIIKGSFSHDTMKIMLLYRCPSSSLVTFYNTLDNLLSDSNMMDVVLGDFNIDILNSRDINLLYVLSNFRLLVNEATHISGSLINHVYVNNESLQKSSADKTK